MTDPTPPDHPRVVLVTGAPGSGKSTLGAALARAVRVPFLARDDVRGGLFLTAGAWGPRPARVPPADEAVDRLLSRRPVLDVLGYATVDDHTAAAAARMGSVAGAMQVDLGLPTLRVATDDGYEPGLDAIVEFAVAATPRPGPRPAG